jgi:hypothetical protein
VRRRTLIAALVALLLLVAGILQYRRMSAQRAADCGDKPKPKDEFTMAAPCDTGTESGAASAPKPAPGPEPAAPAKPR